MEILYISASRVPSRAANSIHVMKMCHAFAENGHSVHLLTAKVTSDLESGIKNIFDFYGVKKNFSLYRLPWIEVPNFAFIYAIQGIFIFLYITLKNYGRRPVCYSRFVLGTYLIGFFSKESILEMHALVGVQSSEKFMFKRVIRRKNFKRLVVISHSLADELLKNYPELAGKILVAHDGADEVDQQEKVILNTHKVGPVCNLGYVGHLYKGRGIKLLIQLVKGDTNKHLHLVGGTEDDIKYWKNETRHIPNISFYGFLPPSETVKFRNSVDILLAPYERKVAIYGSTLDTSRWMSPLKIFEYMSAKKPIICSDLPVLREVLTHNKNSLLCDPDSYTQWSKALQIINNESELKESIAENAYADFFKKYTWKIRAKNVI